MFIHSQQNVSAQSGNSNKKSRWGRPQMTLNVPQKHAVGRKFLIQWGFFTWLRRLSSSCLSLISRCLSRFLSPLFFFPICDLLSWISLPSLNVFLVWSLEWCYALCAAVSQLDYSTWRVFILHSPKISRWLLTSWPDMSKDVSFFVTMGVCDIKKKNKTRKSKDEIRLDPAKLLFLIPCTCWSWAHKYLLI